MLHDFLGDALRSGKSADTSLITERILFFWSDTIKTWEETGDEQGLENAYKSLAHFKASIDLKDEAVELLKESFDLNVKIALATSLPQATRSMRCVINGATTRMCRWSHAVDAKMLATRCCSIDHQRLH
jgi:hypothetical protein